MAKKFLIKKIGNTLKIGTVATAAGATGASYGALAYGVPGNRSEASKKAAKSVAIGGALATGAALVGGGRIVRAGQRVLVGFRMIRGKVRPIFKRKG